MPTTLVTGAAGLVGSHVARAAVQRGDDVRVAVRSTSREDNLAGLRAQRVSADLLNRSAMRRALRGVDRVLHCAGMTSLRASAPRLLRANADVARVVLEESLRAGVERVTFVSSVAAVGPAERGSTAGEEQPFPPVAKGIPYVQAKREAEIQALRVAARGLPVVIVCPAHVLGRGDVNRSSTEVVRRFLRREIPAYVDGALNVVDVEDVARGVLAADECGRIGERYILGNRNFTLDRLFADLGRLSGVEPPALKLPLPAALALARGLEATGASLVTVDEVRLSSMWWAFRSTKARRELGWQPSHHEDTLEATIGWYVEREGASIRAAGTRQPLALRAAGFVVRQAQGALARLVP